MNRNKIIHTLFALFCVLVRNIPKLGQWIIG